MLPLFLVLRFAVRRLRGDDLRLDVRGLALRVLRFVTFRGEAGDDAVITPPCGDTGADVELCAAEDG